MYYKIVLIQRVGKKKRTDRPEPIKTANRKEKKLLRSNQRGLELFLFFYVVFWCVAV